MACLFLLFKEYLVVLAGQDGRHYTRDFGLRLGQLVKELDSEPWLVACGIKIAPARTSTDVKIHPIL